MSKEYETFHQENENIIHRLIESMDALIDKFNSGIIPGEPEKSDALYMVNVYKDAIETFYRAEKPYYKRIKSDKKNYEEERVYNELRGLKSAISLLARLGREKIISIDDDIFLSDAGKFILKSGYCDEIVIEQSGKHYYTLGEKAEKALKSKKIIEELKKDEPTAVIPGVMILEADQWNNLYARRVEFLKRYYSSRKDDLEYILFTLDEKKQMVFGCELNDSVEVTYTFAGVFDQQIDKQIEQLKRLADSGLIDNLVIVIDSKKMAEILEDEGIDSNHTPHISIKQF